VKLHRVINGPAMDHTIIIPADLYARLAAYAAKQGQTPDEVIIELATEIVESESADEEVPGYDPADDPLAPFIGAFDLGDDPGWV
jgi:hypothetical protein